MITQCPKCGEKIVVKGLGRKPLNIPLKNVYDAIQADGSVAGAAREIDCSRGYIYKVLKDNGVGLSDVFSEQNHRK